MQLETDRERLLNLTLDLTPMRMSEIVLKTARFEELKAFYQGVLGVAPFYEHRPDAPAPIVPGRQERASEIRLCFIRTFLEHPYAQVLGIFEIPGTKSESTGDPGLHHMQFRNASMADLFTRYERLKSIGIVPHRTANHGPGTSFYYRDPDRNIIEISANNFATLDEYLAFFASPAYRNNPSGLEIDADEYIARFKRGMPLAELVKIDA
jgi:catechol 2,3-dioxygenase-like lactoylglutathione lyase family enzyme